MNWNSTWFSWAPVRPAWPGRSISPILVGEHNRRVEGGAEGTKLEPAIAVIEKAAEPGGHSLSGAVMDPRGLDALIPDWREAGCPVESPVTEDALYYLTRTRSIKFPFTPPSVQNHGNVVVSLYHVVRWLAEQAEKRGVDVFPGFPAAALLTEGDTIVGVRTGDKGIDKHGATEAELRAGGGHQGQGDGARRRHSGQPHQATRP